MSALGLGLGLGHGGKGASALQPPAGFSAIAALDRIDFTWSAESPPPAKWIVWYNPVDDFSTAAKLVVLDGSTIDHSYVGLQQDQDIKPLDGTMVAGTKYYFWLTRGDALENAILPATTPAEYGRAAIEILSNNWTALRVPYDLGVPTDEGGSTELMHLIFNVSGIPDFSKVYHNGVIYIFYNGFGWFNDTTYEPTDNAIISGAFSFFQNSGGTYTIWDL